MLKNAQKNHVFHSLHKMNDTFTFMLEDTRKKNSPPGTLDAKTKSQYLPDAKKHDSKRDNTPKQD